MQNTQSPATLLKFEYKLIKALKLTPGLGEELQQTLFIVGMFNVGKSFVGLPASEKQIVDRIGFFTQLWTASNSSEVEIAATIFQDFVPNRSVAATSNTTNLLEFVTSDVGLQIQHSVFDGIQTISIRPPTDPQERRCFNLIQEIVNLGKELKQRFDDLRFDKKDLYILRREMDDPIPPGLTKEDGSYEGHRERYNRVRDQVNRKLKEFTDNSCDDDDPHGYGVEAEFIQAQSFARTPPPKQPDPKPFTVPDWLVQLGVRFVDGVLLVPRAIGAAAFFVIMLFVEFFKLNWQFY